MTQVPIEINTEFKLALQIIKQGKTVIVNVHLSSVVFEIGNLKMCVLALLFSPFSISNFIV